MPRIQTTGTVRFALMLLRVYLILMLVLILVYFVRNRSGLLGTRHPTVGSVAISTGTGIAATMPAGTETAPATQDVGGGL
jgi:hypothetical protein